MKTDRFSALRAAAVLLAGLLVLAASLHAADHTLHLGRLTLTFSSPTNKLAEALVPKVEAVQQTFGASCRALHVLQRPGATPSYLREDVAHLIAFTEKDLSQTIESVQPGEMGPLSAWATDQIQGIQEALAATRGKTTAALSGSTPRAVAVVASLGRVSLPAFASVNAAPQPETVPVETSNRLLDQVETVISRIFVLASRNDLTVKLWVGSTGSRHATFSFWSEGQLKGAAPAPWIIRTDDTRSVLRGLYDYKAKTEGTVAHIVQFPSPAGASAPQTSSERLDLVNGSSFFCCRFNESYCHHVDNDKECRP